MIKTLSIQNFKAFDDLQKIQLGSLTLLTGINGRGKSSFLQALLLLSQSLRNSAQHTLNNLLLKGDWVDLGSFSDVKNVYGTHDLPIIFTIETDNATDNRFRLSYKAGNASSMGDLCGMEVGGKEMFSESSFYDESVSAEKSGTLVAPVISGYTSLTSLQRMYYISADRESAQNEEDNVSRSSLWLDKKGRNILNVIYAEGEAFQKKVEQELSNIFDGATFSIKEEGNALRLYMDSTNNGRFFHPVNVGYGYSYALSLITAGLLAEEGEIIIIENPEAHLHPSAQSAVMNFFCKEVLPKKVQLFIETHSDHIVNASLIAVRNEILKNNQLEILFFSRKQEEKKSFTVQNLEITKKGRVKNPPKNFCDQYAMELRTLMGF